MDKLSNDIIESIFSRIISNRDHRNSISEVCKHWNRIEGLSRTSLRILEPQFIPNFLPRFPNLTTIEIDRRILDRNLESIANFCPNLRTLNLSMRRTDWLKSSSRSMDFSNNGLCVVAKKCSLLKRVSLKRRDQVRDNGVIGLVKNCKDLEFLDLSWCSKITDRALDALEDMGSMEELHLEGCSLITNHGLVSLANGSLSKRIKVLDLAQCDQITDFGIIFLQQMFYLEELSLADCGPMITDEGGAAISRITSLKRLNLSWLINLSDETLVAVAENCENLVEIRLTGCESLTGEGFRAFVGHESLEMLGFAHCVSISVHVIEQIVSQCNSLRHLVLDKVWRGWLSPPTMEKLSKLDRVDWV